MRLCTLRIGIHFLKDSGFRALVGLRDPFDDLCLLKGYLYNPIGCVKPAVATEPGKVYRKDISILLVFSIRFVFVSDPGLVSPFFRDELLASVLHFVSVDRGKRGLGGKRIVP
jgi:hypothetical protein